MSRTVIKVEGLGKKYRIGQAEKRADNFREAIVQGVTAPLRRLRRLRSQPSSNDEFWALKDVSFEVQEGEVVGIIGANGAGKSTLLKILSRITTPTEGRALIRGQVSSLLEVGTGFHPELTGRENIYLNGTILGMSHRDIRARFDEIVDFAGVEAFIDTPIKRYSSGMSVRLAFAVAAHLGTDIMIVDEVLAVGDISFQRKCMSTMSDVAKSGRTVLFVSHNINAIRQLCPRSILMFGGRVTSDDVTDNVLQRYVAWENKTSVGIVNEPARGQIKRIRIGSETQPEQSNIAHDEDICIEIVHYAPGRAETYRTAFILSDASGHDLFASWETDKPISRDLMPGMLYAASCRIPRQLLKPGEYALQAFLWVVGEGIIETRTSRFTISNLGYIFGSRRQGLFAPSLQWQVQLVSAEERDSTKIAIGTEI